MQTPVDARTLSRLRWRCRRGLLENDIFIERFFARHEATLTEVQAQGLQGLMDRVAFVGGRLTLDSPPGGPTRLEVRVPTAG